MTTNDDKKPEAITSGSALRSLETTSTEGLLLDAMKYQMDRDFDLLKKYLRDSLIYEGPRGYLTKAAKDELITRIQELSSVDKAILGIEEEQ